MLLWTQIAVFRFGEKKINKAIIKNKTHTNSEKSKNIFV